MDIKRFTEPFFCDALRVAQYLAKKVNGRITEGIGDAAGFPGRERIPSEEVRFLRVEGDDYYEVGFISQDEPTVEDRKLRNKSYWRIKVGDALKAYRESKGISLGELASATGYRVHSLARIEEGRWDMDIAQLGSLLDALGGDLYIK